jgi:O-antigen/teichoic acid export membrane protein
MAWLNKYSSNPFVRNVAVMFSGNGLALVIPFLIAPLITRLYDPSDFASFELFVKFLALISVVTSLRYELAIVLPESDEESKLLTRLCFRILVVFSVLACLVIPFSANIAEAFNNEGLAELMWLFPIGVSVFGAYGVLVQVAMRLEKFRLLAGNKILSSTSNHGSKYLFGLIKPIPIGLVAGHILGSLVSLVSLVKNRSLKSWILDSVRQKGASKALIKKYKDFPIFNGTHAFYGEAYQTGLLLIISIGYGELTLGLFAFAYRYLRVPVQVFGASLAQVLTPRISMMWNSGESLRPLITKTLFSFLAVGVVPFGILYFFGEVIFGFIFGDEWIGAGRYAAIMAPWLLANFAVSPISILPTIVQKQKVFFIISLIFTLAIIALVMWFYSLGYDFDVVLYIMSGGNVLLNLFLFFWFLVIAEKKTPTSE